MRPDGPISLREAATTVHRDRQWWALCLGYGFAAATLFGLPFAAGFVMESLDNSRRGYPTPLPPWSDPATRFLTGLFALMIDFAFFILPLLAGGMVMLCASLALVLGAAGSERVVGGALVGLGGLAGAAFLAMFLAGVAPVGRLRFAREGRIEEAISGDTWRWATGEAGRGPFLRARLASLPAYLPALALAAATVALARLSFAGQAAAMAAGLWLTMAALVYAHLVVVQLYVAAEKEVQRRELGL
ncbi:MAG TPA: DUF4013 domain-containing protein [Chloroflexaceae bacterium]|nr:DUF4013 domain-containing protein [Chloroflexaceae bacterium]